MISGLELKTARLKMGISQAKLGEKIGMSRDTVSYWERRKAIPVVQDDSNPMLIAQAVGIMIKVTSNARAWGWGLTSLVTYTSDPKREARNAQVLAEAVHYRKTHRVICSAKTRKEKPCRNKSEPGKLRCKFHGGKSTGPKTAEGRARIAEAQKRRWSELL